MRHCFVSLHHSLFLKPCLCLFPTVCNKTTKKEPSITSFYVTITSLPRNSGSLWSASCHSMGLWSCSDRSPSAASRPQDVTSVPSVCLQGAESPPLLLNSPVFGAPASSHPAAEASSSEEHQIQLLGKQLQQQEQQALAASAQVPAAEPPPHASLAQRNWEKSAPIVSFHVVSVVAIVTERAKAS